MKACILVLVLAVSMVSCAEPEKPAVKTAEMWTKIRNLFSTLKGKLTDPTNVGSATKETLKEIQEGAETFNDVMVGIGNNILKFSAKVNSQADGKIVFDELSALGKCGQKVLSESAKPLSDVVGIMAAKSIDAAKKVEIPVAPPKAVIEGIEKAAEQTKEAVEKAKEEAKKAAEAQKTPPKV